MDDNDVNGRAGISSRDSARFRSARIWDATLFAMAVLRHPGRSVPAELFQRIHVMMAKIKFFFKKIFRRVLSRRGARALVPINRETYHVPPADGRRNGQRHETDPYYDAMSSESLAADSIFAPRHGAEDNVSYRPVDKDGNVLRESELWERENNSMNVRRRRTYVITSSGAVISPDQVRVRCSECGGYDDVVFRCRACGKSLCHQHARVLNYPSGPIIYCRKHGREATRSWNTWNLAAPKTPGGSADPVFPGKSFSASSLHSSTGASQ